jgi:hypothetical protein
MEEIRSFTNQRMNLDADDRLLSPDETREIYNAISDIEGTMRMLDGNTQVPFDLPSGDNEVIGTCNDNARNAIIYFVKNSMGNHSILRYRPNIGIDKVLYSQPVLNFTRRINHANVIGDLLYWTDGYDEGFDVTSNTPPRKINLAKAIGTNYPHTVTERYQKGDFVSQDGKVYEYINEQATDGAPVYLTTYWKLKGRTYEDLTEDRLYWILDRIKYPREAEAPVVFYTDNPPAEYEPIIIIPDPPIEDALELTFDDIDNVPVADAESVSDWNTFFDLPTNGTAFTSVVVDGDIVKLYGGANIHIKDDLFYDGINFYSALLSVVDNAGCVISAGNSSFRLCDACTLYDFPNLTTLGDSTFALNYGVDVEFLFPKLTTMGDYVFTEVSLKTTPFNFPLLHTAGFGCFVYCEKISSWSFPSLVNVPDGFFYDIVNSIPAPSISFDLSNITSLGSTVGDDSVFLCATANYNTLTVTIPASFMTNNSGNPDGDIQYLLDNQSVTIVTV